MEQLHGHRHGAKRRQLDESIQPSVPQTTKHSSMSISSLVGQTSYLCHISQSTDHSTSQSSTFHSSLQNRNSATITSSAPLNLSKQSSSQTVQSFKAPCAAPARHFRPWEISDGYNSSPAQDSPTSLMLRDSQTASTLPFQGQHYTSDPAPYSYTAIQSPHTDLSSEDERSKDDRSIEGAQNSNALTASQANIEQAMMVCFGMVSNLV
jgi:hypothetical protein